MDKNCYYNNRIIIKFPSEWDIPDFSSQLYFKWTYFGIMFNYTEINFYLAVFWGFIKIHKISSMVPMTAFVINSLSPTTHTQAHTHIHTHTLPTRFLQLTEVTLQRRAKMVNVCTYALLEQAEIASVEIFGAPRGIGQGRSSDSEQPRSIWI